MSIVNQNIRYLRNRLNLTQHKLAELMGIPRSRLGSYEENRATAPADIATKMSELSGIETERILHDDLRKQTELKIKIPEQFRKIHYTTKPQTSTALPQTTLTEQLYNIANCGLPTTEKPAAMPTVGNPTASIQPLSQPPAPTPQQTTTPPTNTAPNNNPTAIEALLINQQQTQSYPKHCFIASYLRQLPIAHMPLATGYQQQRWFEVNHLGSLCWVGTTEIKNWATLQSGKPCLVVTEQYPLIPLYFSKNTDQKNYFFKNPANNKIISLPESHIKEIWEISHHMASGLPQAKPQEQSNEALTTTLKNMERRLKELETKNIN